MMKLKSLLRLSAFTVLVATLWTGIAPAAEGERSIVLASTTSTDNSGLFGHLLPIFEAKTGIKVHVVAVGTGQALRLARDGDADVLLVHDRPSEEKFVADGFGVDRRDVMYNDFVIVGPAGDPAAIAGTSDAAAAFKNIAATKAPFASRGDNSGTHKAELRLWQKAEIDPKMASGTWYRETGSGMGATLNTAVSMNAYALADRGTWLSFRNQSDFQIVTEGDPALFNQYGVILVNPAKHPHVREQEGRIFMDWITSTEGQDAIARFTIGGKQLFFPNYGKSN